MQTATDLILDLADPTPPKLVYAKQNDVLSRTVRLHLRENGKSWEFPADARAIVAYRKPDGKGGVYDTLPDDTPAFSIEADVLTLTLAPQMLTCEGTVLCQLELLTDTQRLSGFAWRLCIAHDLTEDLDSENYCRVATLQGLQQALAELEQSVQQMQKDTTEELDVLSKKDVELERKLDIAADFITETMNDVNALNGMTSQLGKRVEILENVVQPTSWADVQKIVRAGLASRYFAIGDQLQCKRGDKVLTWDVIGIDHDTPADPKYKHSLTLQLHDCMEDKYPFDAAEPTNPDADRKLYGSNNWSESGIRQWLNSAADPGTWWQAKTAYDAPPNYASSDAGFMQGLDADFLASVGEVSKVTAKNTVTDGGGSDTTTERFFLLSLTEIYGGLNNAISEGVAYPYYSDSSALTAAGTNPDTNRIKYRNGTPEYWWLRSPNCQFSPRVRYGTIRGSISNDRASSKYGVAPACCII